MININAEKDSIVFKVDGSVFKGKICDVDSPTFLRFAKSKCDQPINSYINGIVLFLFD